MHAEQHVRLVMMQTDDARQLQVASLSSKVHLAAVAVVAAAVADDDAAAAAGNCHQDLHSAAELLCTYGPGTTG